MRTKLIAIAGGTASGKTSVVTELVGALGNNVELMAMDSYYVPYSHLDLAERKKQNYDHPDAFDITRLIQDLIKLKTGETVEMPVYDYTDYTRSSETRILTPKPITIVEGLLVLAYKDLRDLCDMKIYVDTPADERLARRIIRDTKERGRSIESVLTQYLETVKPMHEQFIEPSKSHADIILPLGVNNQRGMTMLKNHLYYLLNEGKP